MSISPEPSRPADLVTQYAALVADGQIEHDRAQEAVVRRLAALDRRLVEHRLARKSSSLGWLFGARERRDEPIRGLYVFGEVGRGKTMLMDLFFASSPVVRKRRVHFHEFMSDAHERIAAFRRQQKNQQKNNAGGEDPIWLTAGAIAAQSWLLCFDEFNVTDIADAMILGRLFQRLFELGVVVMATSNVAPRDLYRDGLNRALFLPFIELFERHMDVIELAARTDFRLEKLAGQPVWHVPADAKAARALDEAWRRLTGGQAGAPQSLHLLGRTLRVPRAAKGVARFDFAELCEQPLGAVDYLKLAHEFHTIILDRIPIMDYDRRNEAKRFIILIDALYDNGVKLLASAAAEPDALYHAEEGFEAREFKRTASRLIEMRSEAYLALAHGRRDKPQSSLPPGGIAET
ncbi:MAG TPA: cell division protein ZapE [Xanthobacteraceae bacterium]|jgi:cell division protein ZapE|nr:cell division protein ZapE [Xanthobacteraceae bacterium]